LPKPIIEEFEDPKINLPPQTSMTEPFIPLAQSLSSSHKPFSQLDIENHLKPWGDNLPLIEMMATLHIVYQNVHHSLQPLPNHPSMLHLIQNLQSLDCSIFCASKTNINWRQPAATHSIR